MSEKRKKRRASKLFNLSSMMNSIEDAVIRDCAWVLETQHGFRLPSEADKVYADVQVAKLRKKFIDPLRDNNAKSRREAAFQKFLEVNSHMAQVVIPDLPAVPCHPRAGASRLHRCLIRARAIANFILGDFSEEEWWFQCANSSGTTLSVPFKDTSVERKFTFPISVTSEAKPLFERAVGYSQNLVTAIQAHNVLSGSEPYVIREASRGTTVQKDQEIDRFIAVEATANMYLQQGLLAMMSCRLSSIGLDFSSLPTLHRFEALKASLSGDRGTIDWSSASDCTHLDLLRVILPPKWVRALDRVRHKKMDLGGTIIDLAMFSSMGNATTFPIETLVFYCLGMACYLERVRPNSLLPEWQELKSVSVFGDDCILPCEDCALFIEVCTSVGYLVNEKKSFTKPGPGFRESCGGDYYRGQNVRPAFVPTPGGATQKHVEPWLYATWNAFLPKVKMIFGERDYVYKSQVLRCLAGLLSEVTKSINLVPYSFPDDAGIKGGDDLGRLILNLRLPISPIYVSRSQEAVISYIRYVFPKKLEAAPGLRLDREMRTLFTRTLLDRGDGHGGLPAVLPKDDPLYYLVDWAALAKGLNGKKQEFARPLRVRGRYVRARGLTYFHEGLDVSLVGRSPGYIREVPMFSSSVPTAKLANNASGNGRD